MSRSLHAWQRFVLDYGRGARKHDLAAVVGQPAAVVDALRRTGSCRRLPKALAFQQLFALYHGRPPSDAEWPAPRKGPNNGRYEWQPREVAVVASLVGRLGPAQIAAVLTKRLRKLTGDPRAERNRNSVQVCINRIGLQAGDVVGGVTVKQAGREIGSLAIVYQALKSKTLRAFKAGRFLVIPHAEWARWKASRTPPPRGYVQLSSIREVLGIRSDSKLPEFASSGYIPTAVLCPNPHLPGSHSSGRGSWYVDAKVARRLVADRRAGRPMPWHGKPMKDNLRATFKLWQQRKHPTSCATCAQIWGSRPAPSSFAEYAVRYPPLLHGAKRHLNMKWTPGLTLSGTAKHCGTSLSRVQRAVASGILAAKRSGRSFYVSRTDATRWKARGSPSGASAKSWISLPTATRQYLFKRAELRRFIESGRLRSKRGTDGAARDVLYVLRSQCAQLRETIGFTEEEAARRVGVSLDRLRTLLPRVNWRGAEGIPLVTVQAVIKRLRLHEGYSIEEAASKLRAPVEWVKARAHDGTIRMMRGKVDRRRNFITEPMLRRLREVRARRRACMRERFGPLWLNLSEAALDAGVSITTVRRWHAAGELRHRDAASGPRVHRRSVRACARRYWKKGWGARFSRAMLPTWLRAP